jgi:predicted lactoylglutathione lyase
VLYDHIDLRVSDLEKAREFYDPLMTAMGFTRFDTDGRNINYHLPSPDCTHPFFGLMEETGHRGDASRVAFRAASRQEVDRLASVARDAGARAFEAPENYEGAPWYYAAFFEDMDGNKLEICYRE